MTDQLPSKEKAIAEMISVMESARDDGERNCQDLVRIHVGHICATISLLKDLQQVRTCLTGISTCSTCEACRGAALRALGGDTPNPWQPIETAPKDRKDFLGLECGEPGIYYRTEDTPDDAAIFFGTAAYPTHWMPIPSGPSQPPGDG